VGSGDASDDAVRAARRCSERVALALDDEGRDSDCIQLGEAALLWTTGWVEREREAQDGDRVGLGCGAARDPRT
jgi:hypothetical protein